MNLDEHFMLAALKEAQKAYAKDEVPVGAVIVLNNKIIADKVLGESSFAARRGGASFKKPPAKMKKLNTHLILMIY